MKAVSTMERAVSLAKQLTKTKKIDPFISAFILRHSFEAVLERSYEGMDNTITLDMLIVVMDTAKFKIQDTDCEIMDFYFNIDKNSYLQIFGEFAAV